MTGDPGRSLAAISQWIDDSYPPGLDPEAHMWRRVTKAGAEHGEALDALGGWLGENPRKGVTHTGLDLIGELLDECVAALGAVEYLTANCGDSWDLLAAKIEKVRERAGLTV